MKIGPETPVPSEKLGEVIIHFVFFPTSSWYQGCGASICLSPIQSNVIVTRRWTFPSAPYWPLFLLFLAGHPTFLGVPLTVASWVRRPFSFRPLGCRLAASQWLRASHSQRSLARSDGRWLLFSFGRYAECVRLQRYRTKRPRLWQLRDFSCFVSSLLATDCKCPLKVCHRWEVPGTWYYAEMWWSAGLCWSGWISLIPGFVPVK